MMNFDFKTIRPIRNSANNGFEELCCQLAACEPVSSGSRFIRNGTPDGGVEAYWVQPDGTERGWQAKYFDKLESTQWRQLDDSVETALRTHPSLTHYIVCLPFDLPDAREAEKKSLRQKWEDRISKWERIATGKGMTVTFDLWGESELLSRLSLERHVGRRWFWFGKTELSPEWFNNHIAGVIAAAGPRYNAKLKVELPIALRFDALGYTAAFRERLAQVRREYRKGLTKAVDALKIVSAIPEVVAARETFGVAGSVLFERLSQFGDSVPPADSVKEVFSAAHQAREATESVISELKRSTPIPSMSSGAINDRHSARPTFERQYYSLDNFATAIHDVEDFLVSSSAELADRPAMLLTGEAGNGKTHLFCDVAQRRIEAGLPTIAVLGQQLDRGDVWTQIVQRLGIRCTRDELLGALDTLAEAVGGRALIFLDAINEASEIDWRTELPVMLAAIDRYPRLGIAVSCRTTYERQLIRDDLVPAQLSRLDHEGFAPRLFEALTAFCYYYSIETLNTPPLNTEFQNPLFLKLFCQGLRDRGLRRPPRGHHGLQRIFSFLLESVNDKLHQPTELDYPEDEPVVQRAVDAIADAMLAAGRYSLPRGQVQSLLDAILPRPGVGYSKSLLRKLIGEGILTDDLHWPEDSTTSEHVVRFGYERMADYQLARRLLDQHVRGETPDAAFAAGGPFARMFSSDRAHRIRGLLSALIVLLPERTGRELGELMPPLQDSHGFAGAFLEALPWREGQNITPQAVAFVEELLSQGDPRSAMHSRADAVMDRILLLAAQPDHPLNARWLHARLLRLAMPDRDLLWSTFLHRSRQVHSWQTPGAVERLVDWGWTDNADDTDPYEGFDEEVVMLAAITLTWCLTTSNRYLRDRATKALVCVLRHRLYLVPPLLSDFESVDDLYVTERLLCAVYGAVMCSDDAEQVGQVAIAVYRQLFEDTNPPAHVLLRDYARGIVQYALHIGCSIDVDVERIHPPYQSDPVPSGVPAWEELETRYNSPEFAELKMSLAPNWGDFSRYVLGTDSYGRGLHTWTDQPDPFEEYRRLSDELPTLPEPLASRWYQARHGDVLSRPVDAYQHQEESDQEAKISSIPDEGYHGPGGPDDLASLSQQYTAQIAAFRASLSPEDSHLLAQHEAAMAASGAADEDARAMQQSQYLESDFACRWIFTRVMDLGWTPERFAAFDQEVNRGDMRSAQKSERIGKKYQWLAYHELAARIFDHRPLHHDSMSGTQQYEGPWQEQLRDIDPSFLVKNVVSDMTASRYWWMPLADPFPGVESLPDSEWLIQSESIPDFAPLLSLRRPPDGSLWYPLEMSGAWKESEEVQEQNGRTLQRHLMFSLGAWLLPKETANGFIDAVRAQEWTGNDIISLDYYEPFLGEFAWAPSFEVYGADAAAELTEMADPNNSQVRCFGSAPTAVARTAMRYVHEGQSFDCSLTVPCSGCTPSLWLARRMRLSWGRRGFTFVGPGGNVLAYDPSSGAASSRAFVVEQEPLRQFLKESELAIVWLLIGEKLLIGEGHDRSEDQPRVSVFRHVFSLSGDHGPTVDSKTLGYLGQTPTAY